MLVILVLMIAAGALALWCLVDFERECDREVQTILTDRVGGSES